MTKSFAYLRHWITREGYSPDTPPGMVILECIPSRSGMSMGVYDRGDRLFTVNGYGFDRIGTALAKFLVACFQPELKAWMGSSSTHSWGARSWEGSIHLQGATGFESATSIAQAIGLKVRRSESTGGTLIIIEKGN